jgi:hypothetical protein
LKLVTYWRTAHRRNSVRALIVGTLVPFVAGIWASMPGTFVDRLPTWLVFLVSGAISAAGLFGAYTKQRGLNND